ncbi:MAG: restriction endonuclease subunit R [Firmicutes bacterium]|nr:restriction endonuclease subunit R [Bacillota bacterium]
MSRVWFKIDRGGLVRNSIVGLDDHLILHLSDSIRRARRIRFIVAFLMESGSKLLASYLAEAAQRGVPIQILTGKYMSITEPSAIYHLYNVLGNNVEIRFFDEKVRSFHPKAYLFDYDDDSEIIIGSSNISHSALTTGVEWNYRFKKSIAPEDYEIFSRTFDDMFANRSVPATAKELTAYSLNWRKPRLVVVESPTALPEAPEPFGAQVEALYHLNRAREEGIDKGLVVAATGVGKTYLSAFDSEKFKRVLFVAHREEILRQTEATYRTVRPNAHIGYYTGTQKDERMDVCLATVQTLGRENHLLNFPPDYFDYMVVDEFHHAAADSYVRIIEHFKPEFLLGLTATPYRTDNRDIFALCDDNVVYELYLKDAINRDMLVPFRYYGIYDATDYSGIAVRNGQYVVEELEKELSQKERANLVLEKYKALAGQKTLGFCASIAHAEYMARYFQEQGIAAYAVHSGEDTEYTLERKQAVKALEDGKIKVIFAVDIFNEGVDIPALDTVLFLRPTESFVVFLQQLGRGLRKYDGKDYLTVLDFIGNYKRAHYIPALLAGENPQDESGRRRRPQEQEYPAECHVQFDFRVLDLFREMVKRDPLAQRMRDDYYRIKDELGRRPTRVDVYLGSDIPMREFLKQGWLAFLNSVEDLSSIEQAWIDTEAEKFLINIEKTSMSKAYKLPTIGALLQGGTIRKQVSMDEVGKRFMDFYVNKKLHQKDLQDKSNRNWPKWSQEQFTKLARKNPVHFLSKGKFFNYDEINRTFYLDSELEDYLSPALAEHVQDILEYKRIDYFRKRYREDD